MSYSTENGGAMTPFTMPVAPAYGGGDGFGFGGNGAWWLNDPRSSRGRLSIE